MYTLLTPKNSYDLGILRLNIMSPPAEHSLEERWLAISQKVGFVMA